MIKDIYHIRYRRLVFSAEDYFLKAGPDQKADITYYIQCPENMNGRLNEFYTLLIDLSQSIEDIKAGIYHRTVSEINSFLNNQVFEHQVHFALPEKELLAFMDHYDRFASKKNIRRSERDRLRAYNQHGILAVSYIKQNGRYSFINFYRVTKDRATNLSSFRPDDEQAEPTSASHAGRAHRALHWLDMLAFKKMGVHSYDFGGWYNGTSDEALLKVNAFKEQFTKQKVREFTGVIYNHPFLTLLLKWKK